ncbi:flavin-dependent quinone reductase [Lachancea thermotolerans CBS 6340]|uniref:KLTH0A06468p n=1 Tax=Lachancea thermotolerans (strain ATCC 56472 / CBS 6340 / NRRL Y-8284) TaxID=559295 RepID=C5DBZ0_LACTC|nr:KLTH0A06468p [Lachancea thermotolerans CBS 6340]CAR21297.1 KLTH0A06468p [Lachancea thermotolerans CBS 6340]
MLIGVIIGSTRSPRVCPQIAQFILDTIERSKSYQELSEKPLLKIIDIADWNLPLYDESNVPSQIKRSEDYDHEHTKLWSLEIQKYNGFIFVTPQYNWGYPAALKNAIDYLFNEWKGKSAAIVTYGGHGGTKCNEQLAVVLEGLRMIPTQSRVLLSFPDRDTLYAAASGKDLGLSSNPSGDLWTTEKTQIEATFNELFESIVKTQDL